MMILASLLAAMALALPQERDQERTRGKTEIPQGVEVVRDVEYGKVAGTPLLLDIYRPKERSKEPIPAVIFIHGGGWKAGDKADGRFATRTATLAGRGFFAVSINYRLTRSNLAAEVEDCTCAVRWLRANAEKHGVNPDKIGVWGSSAGGHLALMVAYTAGRPEFQGTGGHEGVSSRVTAVCSWYGPTDLAGLTLGKGDAKEGAGGDDKKRLSPLTYAEKDIPPTLLIHGDKDQTVPFAHSERLAEAIQRAEGDVTLVRVKNGNHGLKPVGASSIEPSVERLMALTGEFFDKHLK